MLARFVLCAVLCTCSLTVFAQDGPWTIFGIRDWSYRLSVSSRSDDTLDVMVQIMEEMYHVSADPRTGEVLEPPISFVGGVESPPELYDVVSMDGLWIAAVFARNEPTMPPSHQVYLFWGNERLTGLARILDTQFASPHEERVGWPTNFRLCRGGGDTVWCAWIEGWYYPGRDVEFGVDPVVGYYVMSEDSFHYTSVEYDFQAADAWVIPTPADTLMYAAFSQSGTICFTSAFDTSSLGHNGISFDCDPARPLAMLIRADGHMVVLSRTSRENPSAPARLFEIDLGDRVCQNRFVLYREPVAAASHADYGIAWLSVEGRTMLLSRVDTSGLVVQPEGVLQQTPDGWGIRQADLTIRDDGRVVVVWSEYADLGGDTTAIQLMSLDWDTPLASDRRELVPQPSSLKLSAFPNPFNGELRIEYELDRAQEVTLAIFDVLGREVDVLRAERLDAGAHSAVWSPRGASGIYMVRLSSSEASATKKVLFVK